MQERDGPGRLGWAVLGVAAIGLAAGAMTWVASRRDDVPPPPAVAAAGPATPEVIPLPAPSADATSSLPPPGLPTDGVQPLAPSSPLVQLGQLDVTTATAWAALGSLDLILEQPCEAPAALVRLGMEITDPEKKEFERPVHVDGNGRVVLQALPAETPIRLRGSDAMDYGVWTLDFTLAPDEHRVLTETISRDLRSVVVRVRDDAGRPIDRASIHLVAALTEGETRSLKTADRSSHQLAPRDYRPDPRDGVLTDAEVAEQRSWEHGAARFDGLAAESVSVGVTLDGYAPAWISDVPLDHDPLEILLTLEPGFPVDVEIVDEAGQPRDVDEVELRGTPVSVKAVRTARGRYRFAAFPEKATGITANVQARCWSIEHDAHRPLARMVVPSAGSIAVTWSDLEPHCKPMGIYIHSDSANWGWFEAMDAETRAAHGPVLFEDVAPGDYRVELHCPDGTGADRAADVTVRPGQRTDVRLVP
jgi:hypothetical protein